MNDSPPHSIDDTDSQFHLSGKSGSGQVKFIHSPKHCDTTGIAGGRPNLALAFPRTFAEMGQPCQNGIGSKLSRVTFAVLLQSLVELGDNPDVLTLRRAVVAFAQARGFQAVFFLSPIARNNCQGRVLTNVGFSEPWSRAYRRGLFRIDPLPEIALTLKSPFRWGQADRLRRLSEPEQRYLALLERQGMGDGLAYPLFGAGGNSGLVGFGHHPDLASVSRSSQIEIQLFLQSTYLTYCNIIEREFFRGEDLSERERDVLFWLAQSKSNSAIAAILNIAPSTVDTYMRRIFRKLGVSDRVGAAIAAVHRGHVTPVHYRHEPERDPKG